MPPALAVACFSPAAGAPALDVGEVPAEVPDETVPGDDRTVAPGALELVGGAAADVGVLPPDPGEKAVVLVTAAWPPEVVVEPAPAPVVPPAPDPQAPRATARTRPRAARIEARPTGRARSAPAQVILLTAPKR